MSVTESARLSLRRMAPTDAAFILELLNDPAFIEYIGDRHVRTLDDARAYIANGPAASYQRFGFGLWLVQRKQTREPIGICGLLKRDSLDDVDIGFAFLPAFRGRGYALEAAAAVKAYASETLGLGRIVAITNPDNLRSIRLLEKIGFVFENRVRIAEDGPDLNLFGCALR